MAFELWDTDTGNLIRSYPTIDDALTLVRTAVASYGRRYVSRWVLIAVKDDGALRTIARGAALAVRAAKDVPA